MKKYFFIFIILINMLTPANIQCTHKEIAVVKMLGSLGIIGTGIALGTIGTLKTICDHTKQNHCMYDYKHFQEGLLTKFKHYYGPSLIVSALPLISIGYIFANKSMHELDEAVQKEKLIVYPVTFTSLWNKK